MNKILYTFPAAMILCLCSSCQTEQDSRVTRADNARKDYHHIVRQYMPKGKVYTLTECVDAALKNNLDLKVYELREAVENERKTAAVLGMLPEVNFDYNLQARDNQPGSSSYNVFSGKESLTPSKSSEKTEDTFTIDLALSLIDFGLAYFNSVQAQDRRLIVASQKKRVAQNLVFKVVKTYLQVAAAQKAITATSDMLDRTGQVERILKDIRGDKSISPLRALDEEKRFINLEKRLMRYQLNYENSCIELKSLMGYTPNKQIMVDDKFLDKLAAVELPDVAELEKIALRERPELYETDMQQHISVVEARKAIIKMFPQVRMFADYNNYSNKYLYNNRWWTLGMRVTYDFLSVPRQAAEYLEHSKQSELIENKTVALSLAIMSQVHIAHASILEAKRIYELDDKVFKAYDEHLTASRKIYEAGEDYAKLDLDRLELETAETKINRAFSLSSYYLAYYRLVNTMGIASLDPEQIRLKASNNNPTLAGK